MTSRNIIEKESWPRNPQIFGWLSLDPRGQWRIKGKKINNVKLIKFISKNYRKDNHGRYYFQNGVQQVFVSFFQTPYVINVFEVNPLNLQTHNGIIIDNIKKVWFGKDLKIFIETASILASVDDRDTLFIYENIIDINGNRISEMDLPEGFLANDGLPSFDIYFSYQGKQIQVARDFEMTFLSDQFQTTPKPIHDPPPQ